NRMDHKKDRRTGRCCGKHGYNHSCFYSLDMKHKPMTDLQNHSLGDTSCHAHHTRVHHSTRLHSNHLFLHRFAPNTQDSERLAALLPFESAALLRLAVHTFL